jgi:hypothetical protein
VTNPQPFDPTYEAQVGLNQRSFNEMNIGLDQQQSGLIRAYGLDDPTDPYSRLALLRQSFERAKRSATNSYFARGQGYSGAAQNALDSAARGYGEGYDTLRKGEDQALADIAARRAAARRGLEQGNIDAGGDALTRALNAPVEPPPPPKPPAVSGSGPGLNLGPRKKTYAAVAAKRKRKGN